MATFREKIQALRKNASDAQSASKIIDKLKALKDSNSPDTSYRWVWELIQNAKDVVNTSGSVDIEIQFSETNKTIEFSHNGQLFTTENIVFLIEQVSSKERSSTGENKKKTTGKFGTGFLTTYLLSEKVQVHGYIKDIGEQPRSFQTLLDRTGSDMASIMTAISNSFDMLDYGTECDVDETHMNTKFIYELDDMGIKTAVSGLRNLLVSIPYVFAFVQELNSITINSDSFQRVISRGEKTTVELKSANVTHVHVSTNKDGKNIDEDRYVFVLSSDLVSIAAEIKTNHKERYLLKLSKELPRIFCDFPLLGTNDFSFPMVINSPLFNPTEPRDGIPLVQSGREGGDSDENRNRIVEAINLYNTLLDYLAKKGYKELYNVVKISEQPEKYWLDSVWVEKQLIDPIKDHIMETIFISNSFGDFRSLLERGKPSIYMLKDETPELRIKVWELTNMLMPEMIVPKTEIEHWYNSLWDNCRNFGIADLITEVEKCEDIATLEKRLGCDTLPWLNELIGLFYHQSGKFLADLGRHPSILPNQHGTLFPLEELFSESNIGETYKDLALIAGIDLRKRLLDGRVQKNTLSGLRELTLRNVFSELFQVQMDHETSIEFYRRIINIHTSNNTKQARFIELANYLYPDSFNQPYRASYYNEKPLTDALKFWRDKVCADFSKCNNINGVIEQYGFQNEGEVAKWISKLISYLKDCDDENLLDKYALLPNQHCIFLRRAEIFIDDGSLDDILKDAAMYSGTDVREKMLYSDIFLDLPSTRLISLEYVAPMIVTFVRNNSKTICKTSFDGWETFRAISAWLRDNRKDSRVSKCFKELIDNIHWFYDDEEIAESMAKSEQYDEVLKKYNVANISELATILAANVAVGAHNSETVSISKELLAQWGIASEEELSRALSNNVFGNGQIHKSTSTTEMFNYVKNILNRARDNIIKYLSEHDDYEFDKDNLTFLANTIFRVRKFGHEIYIIARPSDYEQVILYYDTEIDLLDFDKDCELWVEDGIDPTPKKITLGRILKLTGVNKIPLRSLKNDD
jgi:hypothetical protein